MAVFVFVEKALVFVFAVSAVKPQRAWIEIEKICENLLHLWFKIYVISVVSALLKNTLWGLPCLGIADDGDVLMFFWVVFLFFLAVLGL